METSTSGPSRQELAEKNLGLISYGLLILYVVLSWIIPSAHTVGYIFIGIHLLIIAFGILGIIWFEIAINLAMVINLFVRKISPQDKIELALTHKSLLPRFALGITYWLLPIGAYAYNIFEFKVLYIFLWLPIWYPIFYAVSMKKIRSFERRINSPIVQYDQIFEDKVPINQL